MAIQVQIEGLGTLEFPDETPDSVIDATVKREVQQNQALDREAMPYGQSRVGRFVQGLDSSLEDSRLGIKQLVAMGMDKVAPREQTLSDLIVGQSSRMEEVEDEVARKRERDARVGGWGTAGRVAANAATALLPGTQGIKGAAIAGAALGALSPTVEGESHLTNTAIGGALGGAGGGLSRALRGNRAAAEAAKAANATRDASLREAAEAGFRSPPSATNPTLANQAMETWAGKVNTQNRARELNQPVVDKLVREEFGLAEDTPLTKSSLKAVRDKAGSIYKGISQAGTLRLDDEFRAGLASMGEDVAPNPLMGKDPVADELGAIVKTLSSASEVDAAHALDAVKRYRKLGRALSSGMNAGDPTKQAIGRAHLEAADLIEDQLDRHLRQIGRADLADAFEAARTTIAKSHSVEKALNEATGSIDAKKLGTELRKGKPMSGNLGVIARAANTSPKAHGLPETTGSNVRFFDGVGAGGGGTVGALIGGPVGAAVGALAVPVSRGLARAGALRRGASVPEYGAGAVRRGASRAAVPAALAARVGAEKAGRERPMTHDETVALIRSAIQDGDVPMDQREVARAIRGAIRRKRLEGTVTDAEINALLGSINSGGNK